MRRRRSTRAAPPRPANSGEEDRRGSARSRRTFGLPIRAPGSGAGRGPSQCRRRGLQPLRPVWGGGGDQRHGERSAGERGRPLAMRSNLSSASWACPPYPGWRFRCGAGGWEPSASASRSYSSASFLRFAAVPGRRSASSGGSDRPGHEIASRWRRWDPTESRSRSPRKIMQSTSTPPATAGSA